MKDTKVNIGSNAESGVRLIPGSGFDAYRRMLYEPFDTPEDV
jgi:hypothetical protein